jgi:hypothetical protein
MSNKNYQLAITKFNNYNYLTHGAVSSSSRIGRLKYNQLSRTPVLNTTPRYDDKNYKPPVFKKNNFSGNTYYPGTTEGSRNKFYNFQSYCQTNKIVENAHNFHRKYLQKTYIKTRVKISLSDDFIEQMINNILSGRSADANNTPQVAFLSIPEATSNESVEEYENPYIEQYVEIPSQIDASLLNNDILSYLVEDGVDIDKTYVHMHNKPPIYEKSEQSAESTLPNTSGKHNYGHHRSVIPTNSSVLSTLSFSTENRLNSSTLPEATYSSTDALYFEGDVTKNSAVDIADVQYLLEWLAAQKEEYIHRDPVTGLMVNDNFNRQLYNSETDRYYILNSYTKSTSQVQEQLKSLYENAGNFIDTLLRQFISGDVQGVQQLLNTDYYNQLAIKLNEERRDEEDYTYYEFLRKLVNRSLEVLEKSFSIENELKIEMDKIRNELYQTQNPTKPLFEMEATVETVATIRPEYVKYILLYGLPDGGVFDTEKLADIITIMESENNPQ